jgi:LPXTG-motif cell wall-anchored protein
LKNLQENKNYPTEYRQNTGKGIFEKGNYSPTEFREIQKNMGKATFDSENNNQSSPSRNQLLKNPIIIVIGSLVVLVLAGGLFLTKRRKKSNSKNKK